ncbi:pupal cuticle protein 20-like [Pectinophora gossypiella]|uniref:pupal cuticle protein 20-like n=1 Tax=Pectinophora gossypiella TaxID=13191 RepID=UPI00214F57B1|nr:pupal cuticle protein 20-like [Pectinophora gossypiella]
MICLKITSALAILAVVSASGGYNYNNFGGAGFNGGSGGGFGGGFDGGFGGGYSGSGAHIPILSYQNVNDGNGNYRYSYETGNGISAHESGSPRAPGPEGPAVTADGGFSYRAPDGQQISLSYTADENGFHPTGSHLPTPPPIPDAILKSLQFNRQNPSDDGSYNSGRYNNNGGYRY